MGIIDRTIGYFYKRKTELEKARAEYHEQLRIQKKLLGRVKPRPVDSVMDGKVWDCRYSLTTCDGDGFNEVSTVVSKNSIKVYIIGTFNLYKKYNSLIGSRNHIKIYNIESDSDLFDFGVLTLDDVVMELPDNDRLIIVLEWRRNNVWFNLDGSELIGIINKNYGDY